MSERGSSGPDCAHCSGDMYCGVPTTRFAAVMSGSGVPCGCWIFAMPKSSTLAQSSPFVLESMMLSLFKSRQHHALEHERRRLGQGARLWHCEDPATARNTRPGHHGRKSCGGNAAVHVA